MEEVGTHKNKSRWLIICVGLVFTGYSLVRMFLENSRNNHAACVHYQRMRLLGHGFVLAMAIAPISAYYLRPGFIFFRDWNKTFSMN